MASGDLNKLDRQIRMVAGAALIMFAGLETSFLLAILGFIVLATGLYAYCPVYRLLKIDHSEKEKNKP